MMPIDRYSQYEFMKTLSRYCHRAVRKFLKTPTGNSTDRIIILTTTVINALE